MKNKTNWGGNMNGNKEIKVYLEYTTEIEMISKANNIDIKTAVRLFIDTVNTVDDCIFINIPEVRKRIAEL
jgi:hypothetical protein